MVFLASTGRAHGEAPDRQNGVGYFVDADVRLRAGNLYADSDCETPEAAATGAHFLESGRNVGGRFSDKPLGGAC
jgi:hypothetical protein